ncbi:hypothetical protein Tco_0219303 [Tanacetum coccineum]
MIEPCIRSLLIMSKRHERLKARKDHVSQMLAPPQTQNPFLQNLMDVPPRPSNPQPIQTISPLDITLSLSPITPLEIPSSPPSPQPPIMGHPLYYNYHDYHGSNYVCYFHNRNLYLNLRDEMNIMFAHLEYLITTTLTTHFPPPP